MYIFYKDTIEEHNSTFFHVKDSIDGSVEQLYISGTMEEDSSIFPR
jgi:hypothetical protein